MEKEILVVSDEESYHKRGPFLDGTVAEVKA
jgi:hypothetical protein